MKKFSGTSFGKKKENNIDECIQFVKEQILETLEEYEILDNKVKNGEELEGIYKLLYEFHYPLYIEALNYQMNKVKNENKQ